MADDLILGITQDLNALQEEVRQVMTLAEKALVLAEKARGYCSKRKEECSCKWMEPTGCPVEKLREVILEMLR